jgi:hypothetical protein
MNPSYYSCHCYLLHRHNIRLVWGQQHQAPHSGRDRYPKQGPHREDLSHLLPSSKKLLCEQNPAHPRSGISEMVLPRLDSARCFFCDSAIDATAAPISKLFTALILRRFACFEPIGRDSFSPDDLDADGIASPISARSSSLPSVACTSSTPPPPLASSNRHPLLPSHDIAAENANGGPTSCSEYFATSYAFAIVPLSL